MALSTGWPLAWGSLSSAQAPVSPPHHVPVALSARVQLREVWGKGTKE